MGWGGVGVAVGGVGGGGGMGVDSGWGGGGFSVMKFVRILVVSEFGFRGPGWEERGKAREK